MFRHILFAGAVIACSVGMLTECSKKNPAEPEPPAGETPTAPSGTTLLFAEGFGGDLSHWEANYMTSSSAIYDRMRVTTNAAHTGTHSLTTDSNMTALYHIDPNTVEISGTAGLEFYMMAKSLGEINFGLEIGKNPGSSGAVTPAFGIFFDPTDSIKCTVFNTWPAVNTQTMIAPIQADHWYKCKIEVNLTDSTASYYIDDALVHTEQLIDAYPLGISRVLVFRGRDGYYPASPSSEGIKPYYVDDIVFYKK